MPTRRLVVTPPGRTAAGRVFCPIAENSENRALLRSSPRAPPGRKRLGRHAIVVRHRSTSRLPSRSRRFEPSQAARPAQSLARASERTNAQCSNRQMLYVASITPGAPRCQVKNKKRRKKFSKVAATPMTYSSNRDDRRRDIPPLITILGKIGQILVRTRGLCDFAILGAP